MKRIIDGVTYNTDTSTRIARSEYDTEYNHEDRPCDGTLYQTRGGAFFVHQCISLGNDEDGQEVTKDRFVALSASEAEAWFNAGEVEPYTNPFGEDPPEAEAETAPGATIYVRVPALLKRRVEEAAEKASLSANAYVLRCLESCLMKAEESAHADKVLRNVGLIK
jgi:predicted HicB family RNase H-like nuclease